METVLKMLKIDLGLNHSLRDEYFIKLIEGSRYDLARKGAELNLKNVEDIMLLSDYCAWLYRKRTEDVPMARNLVSRIRERQIRGRAGA